MTKHKKFHIDTCETLYQGFLQLQRIQLRHDLFAGGRSSRLTRELVVRGQAVAVLMFDAVRDTVVLVEQFRIGAIRDENRSAWLFELCAGMVEAGEDVADVARREAQEETGCEILALETIAQYFVSPGGSSERLTLMCARVDSTRVGSICGVQAEGEDIKVHVIAADDLLADVFQYDSATMIIALQWLLLQRDRLRAQWA